MLLGWCRECNVPLADGFCYECGRVGKPLSLKTERLLPIFKDTQKWVNDLVEQKHNVRPLPERDVVFINELRFSNRNFIVIEDGKEILQVDFSAEHRWGVKALCENPILEDKIIGSKARTVVKANLDRVERLGKLGSSLIEECSSKFGMPLYVSFSGGKDSMIIFDLALKAVDPPLLFVNTQLEFPESVNFTHAVAKEYGVELCELLPRKDFFEMWEKCGPPARSHRWCCKTNKFAPLNLFLSKNHPKGIVRIVGTRRWESIMRMQQRVIDRNKWVPHSIAVHPIFEWTDVDVWSYIWKEKLPTNPLYELGLVRIGCYPCPYAEMSRFEILGKLHPELLGNLYSHLIAWGKKHGYDEEWVKSGRWRFRRIDEKARIKGLVPCSSDRDTRVYSIKEPESFISFLKTLQQPLDIKKVIVGGKKMWQIKSIYFSATIMGEKVIVRGNFKNYIVNRIYRLLERVHFCIGCGTCTGFCPNGNINLTRNKLHVKRSCLQCGKCAEMLFGETCIFAKYGGGCMNA